MISCSKGEQALEELPDVPRVTYLCEEANLVTFEKHYSCPIELLVVGLYALSILLKNQVELKKKCYIVSI